MLAMPGIETKQAYKDIVTMWFSDTFISQNITIGRLELRPNREMSVLCK